MADNFVQNMAEQQGYSRFPSPDGSPMITKPASPYNDPLSYVPQQKAKSIMDPMLQALQAEAAKRKQNQWPDSGTQVIHPGHGTVLTASTRG